MKTISIVVPVYNGELYIEEFLDSIVRQTYRPLEVLIRDDASKDNSVHICEKWKENNESDDLEVRIFKNESRRGLPMNVSLLLRDAKGSLILLADQDDVWNEKKVEVQAMYMMEHPDCAICCSDRSVTDESLKVYIPSEFTYRGYKKNSLRFADVIKHRGCYAANTMMVRNFGTDVFDIPAGVVCHDYFLSVLASTKGSVDYIFQPLLLYRIHGNNLSTNFKAEVSKNIFQLFMRRYQSYYLGRDAKNNDGLIIERELQQRFGLRLNDYENCVLNTSKRTVIDILDATIDDYKQKRIGAWL